MSFDYLIHPVDRPVIDLRGEKSTEQILGELIGALHKLGLISVIGVDGKEIK